jgi:ABC-2 type transport system ATP-binding protein
VLAIEGLQKAYGDVVALAGVDLEVEAGEICGLLGPNGAGKTTLVSIVAGLRRADAGSVTVGGVDALAHPDRAQPLIGLAPQELGIYPVLTVRQNLVFFGELADIRGEALHRRIGEVAEALELTDLLERHGRHLSGGEKRRLHTAMAMLHRPPMLLLDEPTTGVDVATRARLLAAVQRLAAEDGSAICYSTHYLPEVEALGASVAIIEEGRMIARGTVEDLIATYGRPSAELVFDGDAPAVPQGRSGERDGEVLRLYSQQPGVELATVLAGLGSHAGRLRSAEVVRPSLESVFLALTGRRYRSDVEQPTAAEADDVLAP